VYIIYFQYHPNPIIILLELKDASGSALIDFDRGNHFEFIVSLVTVPHFEQFAVKVKHKVADLVSFAQRVIRRVSNRDLLILIEHS
jgi:hypothetical protein